MDFEMNVKLKGYLDGIECSEEEIATILEDVFNELFTAGHIHIKKE